MTPQEETASIISTDLAPDVLQALSDALRAAGYAKVNLITDYASVARLEETGEGENKEFHLPAPLQETNFVILDEWIGGRSAFELYPILRTAVEKKEMSACLFLNATDEAATRAAVFSAWVSGFELCLTKPVNPAEFQRFAERIRRGEC